MRRFIIALAALLVVSACASSGQSRQMQALHTAQYDWSAAIRWGNFEGALSLVDPQVRKQRPTTALELARFEQVQISGYTELGARGDDARAQREINIGVINRHTMAERNVRYTESWRYDAEAKRWWNTSGLPDLWAGQ